MVVCDDVAIGADEEPGAQGPSKLARLGPTPTRHDPLAVRTTKFFEEFSNGDPARDCRRRCRQLHALFVSTLTRTEEQRLA